MTLARDWQAVSNVNCTGFSLLFVPFLFLHLPVNVHLTLGV